MTTFIEEYRPIFMVATFGVLGLAFYLTYRPRAAAGGSRSKIVSLNKAMLWAVTAVVVIFLFFPQTVTGLFASNDTFTADMDQTVIAIEGMT